jgi:hypothetical protein
MSAHVVVGASHPMLVRKKAAIEQTIAFLRSGAFHLGKAHAEPTACNSFAGRGDGKASEIATAPSATAIEPM